MIRQLQIGLAGMALVVVALAASGHLIWVGPQKDANATSSTYAALAKVSTTARRDIDYGAFDQRLQRMIREPSMVGMAVGIVENGRITFLNGYGETLAGSGDRVTPLTVFRWASVSKGVAGTMAAKLAEMGKLDLDAPIARYAPSLKLPGGNENRATLRDVLSHRLGLYRNAYDDRLEGGEDPRQIRQELASLAQLCPPGTCWSYQNVAFDSASEAVSKAMGEPYQQGVPDLLFKPIGMSSASVTRAGLESSPSWARPHAVGRRPLPMSDAYYRVPAAGGINSNIKDMALWMIAQMGLMPDVLDQKVLDEIHAPLVATPSERGRLRKFAERLHDPFYGFGWRSYDYAGHHIIGHRGGINGYRSLILFDPKLKSGVVALWNSNSSQPAALEFEVMDMLYHLDFRDWMELDSHAPPEVAETPEDARSGESPR